MDVGTVFRIGIHEISGKAEIRIIMRALWHIRFRFAASVSSGDYFLKNA
jgi:hypothetical protein